MVMDFIRALEIEIINIHVISGNKDVKWSQIQLNMVHPGDV
jgi:hypothetical protein